MVDFLLGMLGFIVAFFCFFAGYTFATIQKSNEDE